MTTANASDTCTTREAARRLGVSLRTVQLWTESGVLDAWKTPGGHRRVLNAAVDRLIADRRPPTRSPSADRQLQVLVVEDDPTLLALYRYSFAAFHLPIALRLAPNGYEGLIRIGEERPDILFTDLMMPGIDGFQMLRTLAHRPELAAMQLVVVSGLDAAEIAERGGLPENVTVLSKPIPFEQLEAMVAARCKTLGIGETP